MADEVRQVAASSAAAEPTTAVAAPAATPAVGPRPAPRPTPPGGASGGGHRRRLPRRLTPRRPQTHPELEPLFRTLHQYHPKADVKLVERAYETAAFHHRDQRRRSGDPYITHPLAVATILADLGMTSSTLAAAMLHDTVEDTSYSLAQLRVDFGDEVARLVDGVTKLDQVKYGQATAAETVRKMVVAMARDIRVLVIKLADRLHNMRTLRWMPPEKQESKARETLEIYAPLAHRLGMNTLKWELEDLAFATLYPKMYEEIVRLVGQRAPERDSSLTEVVAAVERDLRTAKVKATVTGRPKHYYSVYQKMIVRGRDFADIYDLVGVRILVDSVRDCYAVLGVIHARWNPVPGRFKDFIAMPKFTMYQSLHTTVIGPGGKPVELQIRTMDMHRAAEYGVAAHWRYKQGSVRRQPAPTTWAGCGSCWSGSARPRTPTSSSTRCATTWARRRCSRSPRRATSSPCRAAPRRSTSRTPSTPRSGTGASVPASTAGWYRWSRRCPAVRSSRSSPASPRQPARHATG